MCEQNAKSLFENLKALLKHFSQSNKSTGILNKSLAALEMNSIHILNWGSTRMAGFLDACLQASKIIVPLLDTIISAGIRSDETKFIGSPKGIFMLQLFADIHKLYANFYLHRVDGDNSIIACEAYDIAMKTANDLQTIQTPLADSFIESLDEDANQNVTATFKLNGADHSLTLNERLTSRNKSLHKVKENLRKIKTAIIDNMVANFTIKTLKTVY